MSGAFSRMVRHELRLLARERTLRAVLLIFAALVGYASYTGIRWAERERAALDEIATSEAERYGVMRARLIRIEAGRGAKGAPHEDPTRAAAVGSTLGQRFAILPVSPLAPLSIGQGELLPSVIPVSTQSGYGLPGREEVANPLHLLAGRLDLAFVILFLLPLFILALSHDMLSAERESGTLALVLAQPVRLGSVLWAKVAARAIVVLGATYALCAVGLAFARLPASPRVALGIALWAVLVLAYAAFWFALAAAANLLGRSSAQQAVGLAGAWLLLAIVVPSLLATGVRLAYPVPSRAEMIIAERDATRAAESAGSGLLGRYYQDHPELVPGGEAAYDDYLIQTHVVQQEVERRMEPVRRRYEAQLAAQRRILSILRFLSPVLVAQEALDDVAGTGEARHEDFQRQVEAFRAEFLAFFEPRIQLGVPFTAAALDEVPAWDHREEPVFDMGARVGLALLGIVLPTVLLALAAGRGLHRYSPAAR